MVALNARDARRVLDALAEIGAAHDVAALRQTTAHVAFELLSVERAGWVEIDLHGGRLRGVHWPTPIPHLLDAVPRDLSVVPLVGPLRVTGSPVRISDVWSRSEWHAMPIWAELYGPNGGEYQVASRLAFRGSVLHGLSLFRSDRDFSDREVGVVAELTRHLRLATTRMSQKVRTNDELGITRRQRESLHALENGETARQAAQQLGISEKTLENHLQEAYRRLGVTNRIAALRRLHGDVP
ncbi:MAG: LuxR C-terminal-related transcriptional regulator [Pseudolysinimonas sp.]|uniref:LuxR C-terminal-related transcriptional regulator n=1 Tax=Pseudolysinimonas sp. TaxID=2680009 RepID=UPI0032676656